MSPMQGRVASYGTEMAGPLYPLQSLEIGFPQVRELSAVEVNLKGADILKKMLTTGTTSHSL